MQHFEAPIGTITTAELAALTAGGDDYIRTKNNEVRGLALRLDVNPRAPDCRQILASHVRQHRLKKKIFSGTVEEVE
jgi:hypothetical protein